MNRGAVRSVSWGQGFPRYIQSCLQAFQERWKTPPKEEQPEVVLIFVISITELFQEPPEIRQPMTLSFVPIGKNKYELCPNYLEKENRWNQISRLDRRMEEHLPRWRLWKISQRWVTTHAYTASHLVSTKGRAALSYSLWGYTKAILQYFLNPYSAAVLVRKNKGDKNPYWEEIVLI